MGFRSKLAIFCAKFISMIIRKLKKGSGVTFPGYIARFIDPNILSTMAAMVHEKIIVIMGTNGKTTTNHILYQALKEEGKKVIINWTGANMLNGIISAFVLAANNKGILDMDYACIEVDEMSSVSVLPKLQPDIICLTNISRDQLDRFGEIDIVCDKIITAIQTVQEAKLVINGDDALSYALASQCKNQIVTYGINEQIFDDSSRSEIRESIFCRFCGKKLKYDFFHYGQLGNYYCPNCGFTRPNIDYSAEHISFYHGLYSFDIEHMHIDSKVKTAYNIYNTISAYAVLSTLVISKNKFPIVIKNFDYGNHRERVFSINNTCIQLHLAKNPVGFQQKISLIVKDPKPKDIIILINDNYQDGRDISWIWDVDFWYFTNANITTITTSGTRRYDMRLRLKYENISSNITGDIKRTIKKLTMNGTRNLYIIANYSGLYEINYILKELKNLERRNGL